MHFLSDLSLAGVLKIITETDKVGSRDDVILQSYLLFFPVNDQACI